MFTKEEIKLAKTCYGAIKKIAGGARIECPECKGIGYFALSKERILADPCHTRIKCPRCNHTGKIKGKWEWEPEWSDICIWGDELVMCIEVKRDDLIEILPQWGSTTTLAPYASLVPLLHWEKLEEILERLGYPIIILKMYDRNGYAFQCKMGRNLDGVNVMRGTRQEAVVQATIELARRIK